MQISKLNVNRTEKFLTFVLSVKNGKKWFIPFQNELKLFNFVLKIFVLGLRLVALIWNLSGIERNEAMGVAVSKYLLTEIEISRYLFSTYRPVFNI